MQKEFDLLLYAAEKANRFYYLLNLLNGWGMHPPLRERVHASSMDFNIEINRMTNALILDRIRNGKSQFIPPQEALFVFQVNLEQKGFYAVLRNFLNIIEGRIASQEPWKTDEWSKQTGLRTGKVIKNIHNELHDASFIKLADEFQQTHIVRAGNIRNSIAHGNFRIPHADTGGKWIFGNYKGDEAGNLHIETMRITNSEFQDLFRRFLGFRMAFLGAITDHQKKYANRRFSFKASNQNKPSEILECKFDKGTLSCKYQGTPLW